VHDMKTRSITLSLGAALLAAPCAEAYAPGAHVQCRHMVHRPVACTMLADEPEKSRSAEFLEEARSEDEQAWFDEMDAAATQARTSEAIAVLRTNGLAAAASLQAELDTSDSSALAKACAAKGKAKPSGKVFKALKKPKGTMALVGEGVVMDTISLGGFDLADPAYLSSEYRTGGCAAVAVGAHTDDALGDGALGSLSATVAEQETARGEFPGPLLAISRGPIVDEVQIAAAKANGASAVVIPFNLNGAERTAELLAEAAAHGLESAVRVCTLEELTLALGLDPKMLAFGDCNLPQAAEMLPSVPEGVLAIADFPTSEVRGAWQVRDIGFNALISGRSMLEMCVRDRVPPSAIIKAVLSKGSVKYGLGYNKGRLEGSKEFLGSMAM